MRSIQRPSASFFASCGCRSIAARAGESVSAGLKTSGGTEMEATVERFFDGLRDAAGVR